MTTDHPIHTFLLVGLGNPGREYLRSRHNVGFRVMDALIRSGAESGDSTQFNMEKKWNAEVATISLKKNNLIVLKPQTFMNRSGQAVQSVAAYYRIPTDHLIVVHDEIDLPLGTLRISFQSGSAGHNGVQSIIDALSSKSFYRIRIGIAPLAEALSERPPAPVRPKGKAFVLNSFTSDEEPLLQASIQRSIEAIQKLIRDGFQKAATQVNQT